MAEERLTAAQQAVVENDGGALLVSAAAGSGKTMVLVRRLLRMIFDPQNPKNIDDFLIITYTKAAATELREKIARQISEKLAENPGNRHLARQLNRLYLAQISTVHSFCSTLLRTYAHTLDVPSDFRVAEQLETAALKQKILQKTLDTVYSELVADPAVKEFIETLGFGRDDRRVAKIVLSVYDSLRCHTDMEQWMHDSLQSVEIAEAEKLSTASWVSALLQNYREVTLSLSRTMRGLASCCMEVPPFDTAYAPAMLADAKRLEELAEIDSWEQLSQIGKLSLSPIGKVPKQEDVQGHCQGL